MEVYKAIFQKSIENFLDIRNPDLHFRIEFAEERIDFVTTLLEDGKISMQVRQSTNLLPLGNAKPDPKRYQWFTESFLSAVSRLANHDSEFDEDTFFYLAMDRYLLQLVMEPRYNSKADFDSVFLDEDAFELARAYNLCREYSHHHQLEMLDQERDQGLFLTISELGDDSFRADCDDLVKMFVREQELHARYLLALFGDWVNEELDFLIEMDDLMEYIQARTIMQCQGIFSGFSQEIQSSYQHLYDVLQEQLS